MEPIRLKIAGLGASADLTMVENALRTVPGVVSVRPDPKAVDEVRVEAAASVTPDALVKAILDAGYVATPIG
jgi:copper chaperone CopZ